MNGSLRNHSAASLLGALVLLTGCTEPPAAPQAAAPGPASVSQTVLLVIDSGDGQPPKQVDVPWTEGLTVIEAMNAAQRQGKLAFVARGSGQTAFVESIGGQRNLGAGAADRNWLFSINGQQGDEGVGVVRLRGGDRILWKFVTGR